MKINLSLKNLEEFLPKHLSADERVKAKTLFFKKLALKMHRFYGGKTAVMPNAPVFSAEWFNVWYTPGVSAVSTAIRDNNLTSFDFTNRVSKVAVVSDSTRVLGDGDCTPSGGLGVMEGKALLMKYLGGINADALCINSKDSDGKPSAQKIIDFVKMVSPSYGAINLEDISQPNCYKVLDTLRKECDIPVWHDDAQGTACVTAAALLNALFLAEKKIENAKIVLYGAGAANSTVADFIIKLGANPANIILFDQKGALHLGRKDIEENKDFYKQWALCKITNPQHFTTEEQAFNGADALIALSKQGPNTIKQEWVKLMADKAIVFACANPVPEIYPQQAKEAGAFITATGRGDFENQVNNSLCFPGILKGVLLCRAKTISDNMALAAARAIAKYTRDTGLSVNRILPLMTEIEVYALQAAAVARAASQDGLAQIEISEEDVYNIAKQDIAAAQNLTEQLTQSGFIKTPPQDVIAETMEEVLKEL